MAGYLKELVSSVMVKKPRLSKFPGYSLRFSRQANMELSRLYTCRK